MDTQKQIHQYLEKITRDFKPDTDYQVYHFLRRLNETTIKGLDIYCFIDSGSGRLFKLFNTDGISLSLIHPLPNSETAVCINLIRTKDGACDIYNISVGTFNLTKTAGNPVDLSAVRMEKIILDVISGETEESVRQHGMYRDFRKILEKTYTEKKRSKLANFFLNLMPRSEKENILEQIMRDLKNLASFLLWMTETKELNRLRSRNAINY